MSKKDYKEELKKEKFQSQEILKFIPELQDKVSVVNKDWFWEGWIDFDVGDPLKPINMYSIKVSGDQRDVARVVENVNEILVGAKLTRHILDRVKSMFTKTGIEVLEEKKNRVTAAEDETI